MVCQCGVILGTELRRVDRYEDVVIHGSRGDWNLAVGRGRGGWPGGRGGNEGFFFFKWKDVTLEKNFSVVWAC